MSNGMDNDPIMTALDSGPYVIDKIKIKPGGVDFLGLRTVNQDMMDAYFPGINNVTRHIRVYSLIAWAWWRAAETAKSLGRDPEEGELRDFVERVETLFTWSHKLAGIQGVPGSGAKPKEQQEPYALEFEAWGRVAENTSVMAAVQYGPSIKHPGGLGYLIPKTPKIFAVNREVLPAVMAIDHAIRDTGLYAPFESLEPFRASAEDARSIFEAWDIRKQSEPERQVFRRLLYPSEQSGTPAGRRLTRARDRRHTIDLLREIMRMSARPLSATEFRGIAVRRRLPDGSPLSVSEELTDALTKLEMLQLRQAQRLALEGLMSWIEGEVRWNSARSTADLTKIALASLLETAPEIGQSQTLRSACEAVKAELGEGGKLDLLEEMNQLQAAAKSPALRHDMPAHAFRILLMSAAMAKVSSHGDIGGKLFRHGHQPRISLERLSDAIEDYHERRPRNFVLFVLEAFVLAQHFVTAVRRNVDNTQRLRLALEEEGLTNIARKPLAFFPTPDRLDTGLSLMSECGLCELHSSDDNGPFYVV